MDFSEVRLRPPIEPLINLRNFPAVPSRNYCPERLLAPLIPARAHLSIDNLKNPLKPSAI